MKMFLLALVLGAANLLAAPAAAASPATKSNFFVEAKIGRTTVWGQEADQSTPELLAGYRWGMGFGSLGFELGNVNFHEVASGSSGITQALYGRTMDARAVKLGVNLNIPFADVLYIEPHAGLMKLSYTGVDENYPNDPTYYDETTSGHYVGIGAGFRVTSYFAVNFNVDEDTAEVMGDSTSFSVTSVGVQFQF